MHKNQKDKVQRVAAALMLLAAVQMAIPSQAFAAVAQEAGIIPAAEQPKETTETSQDIKDIHVKDADGKSDADLRCTGIYVGSDLTENGDTFIGRSEDLNGNNRKDFQFVPAATHDPEKDFYYDIDNGDGTFKIPMPEHTVGYTCIHDNPDEWDGDATKPVFAANGINDNGVAITSTVTTDMNEQASKVDAQKNGLGEIILGDILLGQSKDAKHACEIAGNLIDKYGAVEGYQFFSADANDAWIFASVSGTQWVAFRMPKDKISTNPNIGGLPYKIDLNDTENVMHSANIETLAKENGFAKYFEDGTFDVFGSYGESIDASQRCLTRYWMGVDYFTNADNADKLVKDPALFYNGTPGKKYSTFEILRSLGFRGNGTKFDADKGQTFFKGRGNNLQVGVPYREKTEVYPIGNLNQLQCHFFQVRNDDSIPVGLRIIQWECMGPGAYGVFLPFYTGLMNKLPAVYNPGPTEHSGEDALTVNDDAENSMYYTMNDFNKLVMFAKSKGADVSNVRAYLDMVQQDLINQQKDIERAMLALDPAQYTAAANQMVEVLSNNLHTRTVQLNKLLRDYINAGDFSKPFTFAAELNQPLAYTSAVLKDGKFANLPNDASRQLTYNPGATTQATQTDGVAETPAAQKVDTAHLAAKQKTTLKTTLHKATAQTGDVLSMVVPGFLALAGAGFAVFGYKKRK